MSDEEAGPEWLSAYEAGEILGLTWRTLNVRVQRGELPAHRIGGRVRFRRDEVEQYMESARVEPGDLRPPKARRRSPRTTWELRYEPVPIEPGTLRRPKDKRERRADGDGG